MANRIEDYALIGDTQSAALVGRDGSIDWACFPRFDSGACFASLLGTPEHGRWLIAPKGAVRSTRRAYRENTLVLETEFETDDGAVRVIDFMPPRDTKPDIVRIVEGLRGKVALTMELCIRFDYGSVVPWVRKTEQGLLAVAGPNGLTLRTDVPHTGQDMKTVATFEVSAHQRVPFVLTWHPSHEASPRAVDPERALRDTEKFWRRWAARCTYEGPWREPVVSSLMVLKALTYAPTGGIVAAATTSLPEWPQGVRNWDYRYCWLRDATFTLLALLRGGYEEEAEAWRDWLLRSVAGDPAKLQIMYGVAGERRLDEWEVEWLPGFGGAKPVRIGNAAVKQLQLDVYGEVMDALFQARRTGMNMEDDAWRLQRQLLEVLETKWQEPDEGLWEVRGPRRHFTHSKVMAWVALDRAVKMAEQFKLEAPLAHWRQLREQIHGEVCAKGFDTSQQSFTQFYGGTDTDASLLMIPLVGFLPATDPRMRGTVRAIQKHLLHDGFVRRYPQHTSDVDGLPPGEGAFLACTFWLADNLALMGERAEATAIFERLLTLRNDVGLLAEEYDPVRKLQLGNVPQAFSHVALVNSALNLAGGPSETKGRRHP